MTAVATTVAAAVAAQFKALAPAVPAAPPVPQMVSQAVDISFSDSHLFPDITFFLQGLVARDAKLNPDRVRSWLDYEAAFMQAGVISIEELRDWTTKELIDHIHMPFGMARVFVNAVASEVRRVQKLKASLTDAQEADRLNYSASNE
jgi:hypothetical protein